MSGKIYTGAVIVTMDEDRRILDDGALAVEDGRIAMVDETAEVIERYPGLPIEDCQGCVLLPGFVDAAAPAGLSGLGMVNADDPPAWHAACRAALDAHDTRSWREEGLRHGGIKLSMGYTASGIVMHSAQSAHIEAQREGLREAGLSPVMIHGGARLTDDMSPDAYARAMAAWLVNRKPGDMLLLCDIILEQGRVHAGLPGGFLDESLGAKIELVSHMLADTGARAYCRMPGGVLAINPGLFQRLKKQVVFAGLNGLTAWELPLAAEFAYAIAYAPEPHLERFPLPEAIDRGVPCALSSYGTTARMPRDPFELLRRMQLFEITWNDDYHYMPAGTVAEMLTINAARALGIEGEAGSLEAGKRADFLLLDWQRAHLSPNFMPLQSVLYRAVHGDIALVVSQGVPQAGSRYAQAGNEARHG